MIELVQFPWSPFCIVQRRILEFSGAPFKITNIPANDRSLVWKLTKEQHYGVPILRDGARVIFETGDDSQVIAKHLDSRLKLGLFPAELEGEQSVLWRWIENEVEGASFRLNDVYCREFVPKAEQVHHVRHKERKFGRGCIDQWRENRSQWLERLEQSLEPFEQMLASRPFLLDDRPRFVDFDLYGMLGNFLFSGHYQLPRAHKRVRQWHGKMIAIQFQKPRS